MNLKNIFVSLFIVIFSVTIIVGCHATDVEQEPVPSPTTDITETPRIEIMGGSPTGLVATTRMNPTDTEETRAVHEPDQPGYCNADMLQIWAFTGEFFSIYNTKLEDLKIKENSNIFSLSINSYTGEYYQDRYTTHKFKYNGKNWAFYGFYFPAMACNNEDLEGNSKKFDVDITTNLSPKSITLRLIDDNTPEIYFGHLLFKPSEEYLAYNILNDDLIRIENKHRPTSSLYATDYSGPLYGKLYRIVSQLNVSISDVNPNEVEKMEMYLSEIPTEIKLYGKHGKYYPVEAEPKSTIGTNKNPNSSGTNQYPILNGVPMVKVAEVAVFKNNEAKLSTFLLPSEKGRTMTIRVYYTDKKYIPRKQGTSIQSDVLYVDYEIYPPHNVLLTGDDAAVYTISNAEQKSGSDLYLYKSTTHEFFSYSNVRVNLKGTFDNFFTDNSQ